VLRIRDPVFFIPGSGMGKNPDPGWASQIIFLKDEKQCFGFKIGTKILWCGIFLTMDPGWKISEHFYLISILKLQDWCFILQDWETAEEITSIFFCPTAAAHSGKTEK
jgi:hypothetical protein